MTLRNRVSAIRGVPQIRTLTFVVDACKVLEQARKVSAGGVDTDPLLTGSTVTLSGPQLGLQWASRVD